MGPVVTNDQSTLGGYNLRDQTRSDDFAVSQSVLSNISSIFVSPEVRVYRIFFVDINQLATCQCAKRQVKGLIKELRPNNPFSASLRKKREAEKVNLVNDYAETPLSRGKRGLTKKARKNHLNMKPRTTSPTERKLYVAIALDYSMVKFHQPEQSRYNTMNSIPDLTPKLRDYLISLMEIVDT